MYGRIKKMPDIEIRKIVVNEMPKNCGECPLLYFEEKCGESFEDNHRFICSAAPKEYWKIEGNPYNMKYRRSDCKLVLSEE